MANDIEVQIGLEGGDELKRQISDINSSLRTMKRSVDEVRNAFNDMADGFDQLDTVVKTMTSSFEDAKKAMTDFSSGSSSAMTEVADSTSWLENVQSTFSSAYDDINKAVDTFGQIDEALNAMAATTQVAEAAQIALNTAQSLIPTNLLIAGITGVTVGLGLFLSSIADTENETMQLYASIDQASQGLGNFKASLDESAKGREQRTH